MFMINALEEINHHKLFELSNWYSNGGRSRCLPQVKLIENSLLI